MARIVIIQHETEPPTLKGYSIAFLADAWRRSGHEVLVPAGGQSFPDADIAVLHVNLSVVPQRFVDLAKRYPIVINGRVLDIRKRAVSRNLLTQGDGWTGPVITKSDLNCKGLPERVIQAREQKLGRRTDEKPIRPLTHAVFANAAAVPPRRWSSQRLVVEKFLPEREGDSYFLRTWLFFGDRGSCNRFEGRGPIVKGDDIVSHERVEVPEAIQAERERLGFDFGKFDFVVHDGEPILLDANKTPSLPPASAQIRQLYDRLAEGLGVFLPAATTS
jgi:hypothetical protein